MIGWQSTLSRDYDEAVVNGLVDDDLDRMAQVIQRRKAAIERPTCAECGEPLPEYAKGLEDHVHQHRTPDGHDWEIHYRAVKLT